MPLALTGLGFGSVKPVAGSGKGPAGSQKLRDRQNISGGLLALGSITFVSWSINGKANGNPAPLSEGFVRK